MPISAGSIVTADSIPGYVTENQRTTQSGTFTTTETVVQSVTFSAVSTTRYKITAVQSFESTVAGDSIAVRLRWASGSSVTSAGAQIHSVITPGNTANLGFVVTLVGTVVFGVSGNVTVGVTGVRNTGATGIYKSFGSANQIDTIVIERI